MRVSSAFFVMCFGILLIRCFDPTVYEANKTDTKIEFSPDDTTIVANGVSKAKIKFQVLEKKPTKSFPVVFKTTVGSFVGGEGDSLVVIPTSNYSTTVKLVSASVGVATVTAKIRGIKFEETATVNCSQAFPDQIVASVDSIAIHNSFDSEVIITASVSISTGGVPSSGHQVVFTAYTEDNEEIGYYQNGIKTSKTNSAGKATIRFTVGETDYTGRLRIVASTKTETGATKEGETFLQVIN